MALDFTQRIKKIDQQLTNLYEKASKALFEKKIQFYGSREKASLDLFFCELETQYGVAFNQCDLMGLSEEDAQNAYQSIFGHSDIDFAFYDTKREQMRTLSLDEPRQEYERDSQEQAIELETVCYRTHSERWMTAVDGVRFYRCTGQNSAFNHTWQPFCGLHEEDIGADIHGYLYKPKGEVDPNLSLLFHGFNDKDARARFNNVECAIISAKIGGGLWDSIAGKLIFNALYQQYPESFKNQYHTLEPSETFDLYHNKSSRAVLIRLNARLESMQHECPESKARDGAYAERFDEYVTPKIRHLMRRKKS